MILYLLSCTLRHFLPRSVLICQNFLYPQLRYFATPLNKGGGNFSKSCQKVTLPPPPDNFERFG